MAYWHSASAHYKAEAAVAYGITETKSVSAGSSGASVT